jgi:Ca-activated chloride channel homolog
MKRNSTGIFLATCSLTAFSAFYNFTTTGAQTVPPTQQTERVRQVTSPTPTPTPTPLTKTSPTTTPEVVEDDGEVIKIDAEIVNLSVRVVDRNNRSIGTLQQKDFKVYEDNVAQPIEFFTKSEVPTNYSLVIDNSGSLRAQLDKVIEAGKVIIGTNRPADETSIVRFVSRDKISIEQPFTANKVDLNDALENLYIEGGQTAIIDAVYLAAEQVNEYEKSRDPNDRKRRALIVVSDGEDRDSFYNEKQLFDLLKETDVQIYTIGFVGELDKEGGFISKSPQSKAKSLLERLAAETGGKSYFPNNTGELNDIASNIATELRTQYSIGYVPTNDKKDGSLRSIKVAVTDGPDKQKRIAVTRNTRKAGINNPAPTLQGQKPKGQ